MQEAESKEALKEGKDNLKQSFLEFDQNIGQYHIIWQ